MAGSFMSNIASTAAGVAIGRGIDRALFGGGSGSAPMPEEIPADEPNAFSEFSDDQGQIPDAVCSREVLEFKKCLDRTNHQVAECQWNLEILTACQQQAAQNNGFADAPRL